MHFLTQHLGSWIDHRTMLTGCITWLYSRQRYKFLMHFGTHFVQMFWYLVCISFSLIMKLIYVYYSLCNCILLGTAPYQSQQQEPNPWCLVCRLEPKWICRIWLFCLKLLCVFNASMNWLNALSFTFLVLLQLFDTFSSKKYAVMRRLTCKKNQLCVGSSMKYHCYAWLLSFLFLFFLSLSSYRLYFKLSFEGVLLFPLLINPINLRAWALDQVALALDF